MTAPAWRPSPKPASLCGRARVDVDVRGDVVRGKEPFVRIMTALGTLPPGAALAVRAPFEPVPLYGVLGRRGLTHWTECHAPDDWTAWFWRDGQEVPAGIAASPAPPAGTTTLDVRGLEPPEPMVRILERLETLGSGATLEVLHDRRPLFLYPQLDERGFVHETDEPAPGLVRLRIRHGTGSR